MSVRVICPKCRCKCLVADENRGKTIRCGSCKGLFTVRKAPSASEKSAISAGQTAASPASKRGRVITDDPPPARAGKSRNMLPVLLIGAAAAILFVFAGAGIAGVFVLRGLWSADPSVRITQSKKQNNAGVAETKKKTKSEKRQTKAVPKIDPGSAKIEDPEKKTPAGKKEPKTKSAPPKIAVAGELKKLTAARSYSAFSGSCSLRLVPNSPNALLGGTYLQYWDVVQGIRRAVLTDRKSGGVHAALAVTADGALAATCIMGDKDISLWDLKKSAFVGILKGHRESIKRVVFLPDGKRLLSAGDDKVVFLWDVNKRRALHTFGGFETRIEGLDVSPNGSRAVVCTSGGRMRLWDIVKKRTIRIRSFASERPRAVAFTPDGKRLVCAGKALAVVDAESLEVIRKVKLPNAALNLSLSPDDKMVVTCGLEPVARVWETEGLREIYQLQGQGTNISDAVFSADGKAIHSCSYNYISDWHLDGSGTAVVKGPTKKETDPPNVVKTNPPKNVPNLGAAERITNPPMVANVFVLSPYARLLAGAGIPQQPKQFAVVPIHLWDFKTKKEIQQFRGHTDRITALMFHPKYRQILSSSYDGTIRVWDIAANKEISRLTAGKGKVKVVDLAISSDARLIAYGLEDNVVHVWELKPNRMIRHLRGHTSGLLKVAFSAKDYRILSGSWAKNGNDYSVRLWEVVSGRNLLTMHGHKGRIWSVDLSKDGRLALSASEDKTARLWDTQTGKEVHRLEGHEGPVTRADFTPNSRYVMTASGKYFYLWDVENGKLLQKTQGDSKRLSCAMFLGNSHAVSGGDDWVIRLWALEKLRATSLASRRPSLSDLLIANFAGNGTRPVAALKQCEKPPRLAPGGEQPVLIREMFRQGLLLALREHGQTTTRDQALGETLPSVNVRKTVTLATFWDHKTKATIELLERTKDGKSKVLWQHTLDSKKKRLGYVRMLEEIEKLTRLDMPPTLAKLGIAGTAPPKVSTAKMPIGVEDNLSAMTFTAQFAAVRDLHKAIREKGESPDLLGGLVRGYANLGVLAEHHWSAAHKVYKARSLLYAQRLAARAAASPWGLWHRAYALALTGLHKAALDDIEAADKLWKDGNQNSARPVWTDMLTAYCHFDTGGIAKLAKGDQQQLGLLLQFFTVDHRVTSTLSVKAAQKMFETNPECFRMYDALCQYGSLGVQHQMTVQAPSVFERSIGPRLQAMAGFPKPVAGRIAALDENAWTQQEPGILRALREAPDADELSWTALAQLIRETRFVHVFRRTDFMRYRWTVPVQGYIAQMRPLIADHPYRQYIETHGQAGATFRKTMNELVSAARMFEIEPVRQLKVIQYYQKSDPARASNVVGQAIRHNDGIHRDLAEMIYTFRQNPVIQRSYEFYRLSPHSPVARSYLIKHYWKYNKDKVRIWENEPKVHPLVAHTLANHYAKEKEWDKAEKYFRSYLKECPSEKGYLSLAEIFQKQKNDEKWLEVLQEYLQQPETGLAHSRTRVKIARHFMKKKQWQKAKPFAEKAAGSFASWALLCLAECHEGLKEYEKADSVLASRAGRYPLARFDWYCWCLAIGKGNVEKAKASAGAYIDNIGNRGGYTTMKQRAHYGLLTGNHKDAAAVFSTFIKLGDVERYGFYLALTADEMGNKQLRDANLNRIAAQPSPLGKLAKEFKRLIAGEKQAKFETKLFDQVYASLKEEFKAEYVYLVGWFLKQRGDNKLARAYLQHCQSLPQVSLALRALCAQKLKRLND